MKSLYWLFPFSVIAFSLICFLSFRGPELFFSVEGQVLDLQGNPVFNAIVTVEKLAELEIPYYEPTNSNGHFKLNFNAVEGKPVLIEIIKEEIGYASVEIIPTTAKQLDPLEIKLKPNPSVTFRAVPENSGDGKVVPASVTLVRQ